MKKIISAAVLAWIWSGWSLMAQVSFSLPPNLSASNIVYAEYFFDNDPGYNNGTSIPLSASTDVSIANLSISIGALSNGVHRLYLRTRDLRGSWSLTNVKTVFIVNLGTVLPPNPAAANIVYLEYFIDTDPGFGSGTPISITPSQDVSVSNTSIDITGLSSGTHRIYFRTRDVSGAWSLTNMKTLFIVNLGTVLPPNPAAANIVYLETFIDTDPGFGNGTPVSITPSLDVSVSNIPLDISSLANGVHYIYFRTRDAAGRWSLSNGKIFSIVVFNTSIPPNPVAGDISRLEYFFDNDPGFGNGIQISLTPSTEIVNYGFAADISGLADGQHWLYLRTYDAWSMTNVVSFLKGAGLPVTWLSFTAKAVNDVVQLDWKTARETNNDRFEIERSANGRDFKTIGRVAGTGNTQAEQAYAFTDNAPLDGVGYYRIRQVDRNGNASYSVIVAVKMNLEYPIRLLTNPVYNSLRVSIRSAVSQNNQLRILDISGRQIMNLGRVRNGVQEINVSGLPAGTYVLEFMNGNQVFAKRFIK